MTKDEISKIKKHIEIHARRERGAIIITEILRKAVDELEHIDKLKEENEQLKIENVKMRCCGNCSHRNAEEVVETCRLLKKYTQKKGCCSEWEAEK